MNKLLNIVKIRIKRFKMKVTAPKYPKTNAAASDGLHQATEVRKKNSFRKTKNARFAKKLQQKKKKKKSRA